jgi:hypothetical protein
MFCLIATLCGAFCAAGPIENLAVNTWYEVPNSHLSSVEPSKLVGTMGSFNGIMGAWSSGAFDTKRNNLIVWGGGHSDYAGNEIYIFSLDSLKWTRLTNPSDPPATDVAYASDGGPCSRHTYDYIQYIPDPVDRFCTFGGAGFYSSGQTGTSHVDCFNFSANSWETRKYADSPSNGFIGAFTAYDPVTGFLWEHGGGSGVLARLNFSTNTWAAQSYTDGWFSYYITADVDPVRRLMVGAGGGQVWSWNIAASGGIAGVQHTTTGDNGIVSAASPGFVYVPAIAKFVAWSGGASVYTLDAGTWVWTKVDPAAGNTVTPTAANGTGTFGRFRYSPKNNVFVVVNDISQDVFIYRLTAGTGKENKAVSIKAAPAICADPNPFGTTVRISLPEIGQTSEAAVYDISGKRIADLRGIAAPGGGRRFLWNGAGFAVGLYTVKINAGTKQFSKRIILSR